MIRAVRAHSKEKMYSSKSNSPDPDTSQGFPVSASTHGMAMITVHVRHGPTTQSFLVHRDLLHRASQPFAALLAGGFMESNREELTLKDECPMAFEVLYQWLYSGKVLRAQFYTQGRVAEDVLWLRVYILADKRLIYELQKEAYEKLRGLFSADERAVPSSRFVEELFCSETDQNHEYLQSYVIAHTAFWIHNDSHGDWQEWEAVLERRSNYSVRVAVQLAKIHSSSFDGCREHPSLDMYFDHYRGWTE